jgi:DinB family protein
MQLSRKLQEIVDEISSQRQALIGSVRGLSEAQLNYKAEGDPWSISDILHHLALAGEASFKLLSMMVKQAEERGAAPDLTPDESILASIDHIKQEAENQRVQAPDFVTPHSHIPADESIARLAASSEKFGEVISRLARFDLGQLIYPHPFFKDLNLYQWILVSGWHEGRHTAQVERIKSQADFPKNGDK